MSPRLREPRHAECEVAPCEFRSGQREDGNSESLRVPECMTLVAFSCEPLCGKPGATIRRCASTQVHEVEAHRTAEVRIAWHIDRGNGPEGLQLVGRSTRRRVIAATDVKVGSRTR